MRLLFVADGRSSTTLSWVDYWIKSGDEVHLISTYPCEQPSGVTSFNILPLTFSRIAVEPKMKPEGRVFAKARVFLRFIRYFLEPYRISRYQRQFLDILRFINPDLVHALRIPFEGMISYVTPKTIPLLVSIWGNDITLHAHGSPSMAKYTRKVLNRADALLADNERDIRLGRIRGLDSHAESLVIPGAGGIRLRDIKTSNAVKELPEELPDSPLIINPRGQRPGSLRQDIFFRSIPIVLKKEPSAFFVFPALRKDTQAEQWVTTLKLHERARLWPKLSQPQLWTLFKKAQIYASPSLHDGVPNSLLEAIACGCFPVVGDIESMREWITDGENGYLVDATDEISLAGAVLKAIKDPGLRCRAAKINANLIAKRGDYAQNMKRARNLYELLCKSNLAVKL